MCVNYARINYSGKYGNRSMFGKFSQGKRCKFLQNYA